MKLTWTKMRQFRIWPWLHMEGAWVALLLFGMGCFGWGFLLATLNARADRAQELTVNYAAFSEALAAKDTLINQLAGSAVRATGQAADAATAVVDATATAKKATATAKKAVESVQAKSSATRKDLDKMK